MLRRNREDRNKPGGPTGDRTRGPSRADRHRRRPSLEGLEGRQLLSTAPLSTTAAVAAPRPSGPVPQASIVVRPTALPPLKTWATLPYDGIVASFVSNANLTADRLTARVDWGDGRVSPGTIVPNPWGGFDVRGTHTYPRGVNGPTWVRVDVFDAWTGQWIVGAEQRAWVSRPGPQRLALTEAGIETPASAHDPAARPQPARLRFVDRRQNYHAAANRYAQGIASADDIRYLRRVQNYIDQQNRSTLEKLGDRFVDALPFS